MTPLSRTILEQHRIRKTGKQKSAFVSLLQAAFPELRLHSRNQSMIIGDPEKAKLILSAHYATGSQRRFPGFVSPKSPLSAVTMPGCKHIARNNTAGLVALCELAQTLDGAQLGKVAFVLYDKKMPLSSGKLTIDLDCASTGNHILVAADKIARQAYGDLLKRSFCPTSSKSVLFANREKTCIRGRLPNAVTVGTLHHKKHLGFCVCRESIPFDSANIKLICESVHGLLRQL